MCERQKGLSCVFGTLDDFVGITGSVYCPHVNSASIGSNVSSVDLVVMAPRDGTPGISH